MSRRCDLFYLYGITQARESPFVFKNLNGRARIDSLTHKTLMAVFSKVPSLEFSEKRLKENLKDMKWLEPRIWAHEHVLETIMRESAVIPLKFGCLFANLNRIRDLLKSNYEKLQSLLQSLKNKEEWSVKLYGDRNFLKNQFTQSKSQETQPVRESLGEGTLYLLKQKHEEALSQQFEDHLLAKAQDFHRKVSSCASNSTINALSPKEFSPKKNLDMALNAAYLVEKDKKQLFEKTLQGAIETCGEGFEFAKTGPYPPYCFSQVTLKKPSSLRNVR